jgi:hypothetical protein
MSAKDNFIAPGELVNAMKDLIPGVLRHQAYEGVQTDDALFVEVVENSCRESIGRRRCRLNIRM